MPGEPVPEAVVRFRAWLTFAGHRDTWVHLSPLEQLVALAAAEAMVQAST